MLRILAAVNFFTRLPFWRLAEVPSEYFKNVVSRWALVGWLTAGLSVIVLYTASLILPASVAVLLAIVTRLLITGCLHEDGLADFFDGFGGGTSRERILSIMKDSHIGSYGVIGLILYFALLYTLLSSLPLTLAGSAILAGDPFSKGVAGMIINRLPYARKAEEAKNKTVYSRMTTSEYTCCLFSALIPMFWLPEPVYLLAGLLPVLVFYFLTSLMKKKIQGYTGDCCGATFLLCELSFYLGLAYIFTTINYNIFYMEFFLGIFTSVDIPAGYAYGQTDVPLRPSFEDEAEAVKKNLSGHTFDKVWSSPLTRCTRLAAYCGYPDAEKEARIKEISFGEWEMKSWDELSSDPRSEAWFNDWINVPAPSGESLQDQYTRVSHFLNEIRESDLQKVCIFAHGGVLTCARVYAGEYDLKEAFKNVPSYGTVIRLELD